MLFVCWAWRDSQRIHSHSNWNGIAVMQANSYASIGWLPFRSTSTTGRSGGVASSYLPHALPMPFFVQGREAEFSATDAAETLRSTT